VADGDESKARIAALDELLQAQRTQSADLKRDNDHLRGQLELQGSTGNTTRLDTAELRHRGKLADTLAEQLRANDELRQCVASLTAETELLDREKASLELQIDRLERALGRGEFDPATTRVLQFGNNPAAQDLAIRQSTLDGLQAENAALLERLATKSTAAGPTDVPQATLDNLRREIAKLEAKVQEREKARVRLSEVRRFFLARLTPQTFAAKATEFRKTVHDLFGFKLDVREGGRVRLTSQFAPTPDSHLVFEPEGATGQLKLLGGTGEAGAWDANPTIKSSAEFWITGRHVRRSDVTGC